MNTAADTMDGGSVFSALESAASAATSRQKPFLEKLEALYSRMDGRYSEIATLCGFHCRGCEDSCCRTVFYHHTLVEYLFIREGIFSLEEKVQEEILLRSGEVSAGPDARRFCPLNNGGRCRLYAHRPMICRLHGIAWELRRPDGNIHRGPGCAAFDAATGGTPPEVLNRTDFYLALSTLEREAREAFGFSRKIRMTISQMVESILHSKDRKERLFHEAD